MYFAARRFQVQTPYYRLPQQIEPCLATELRRRVTRVRVLRSTALVCASKTWARGMSRPHDLVSVEQPEEEAR